MKKVKVYALALVMAASAMVVPYQSNAQLEVIECTQVGGGDGFILISCADGTFYKLKN